MVDYENLPATSLNKLNFNKDLFQKQTKVLMIGNIIFGIFSILTVAAGYFIINRQHIPGANQHLLCLHSYEWIYLSPVGNIFGTLHQILVLMQINITQYVLVRLPDNEGVFDEPDMTAKLGHGLRDQLLNTAVNEEGGEDAMYDGVRNSKNPLAAILSKIKESQKKDDDHFRA